MPRRCHLPAGALFISLIYPLDFLYRLEYYVYSQGKERGNEMKNKITATHENGSILTHKATDKDVEYAITLMKECGYIRFRIETIGK